LIVQFPYHRASIRMRSRPEMPKIKLYLATSTILTFSSRHHKNKGAWEILADKELAIVDDLLKAVRYIVEHCYVASNFKYEVRGC
jgi:hypothetical protein